MSGKRWSFINRSRAGNDGARQHLGATESFYLRPLSVSHSKLLYVLQGCPFVQYHRHINLKGTLTGGSPIGTAASESSKSIIRMYSEELQGIHLDYRSTSR